MKQGLIITGGSIEDAFASVYLKEHIFDFVIAVDGGLKKAIALGVRPDLIVGDFDTVSLSLLKDYEQTQQVRVETYSPVKDETDTRLAIDVAVKQGCTHLVVLGALGGRFDHSFSNLQLLLYGKKRGVCITIQDQWNKLYLLPKKMVFYKNQLFGTYLSFLPFSKEVTGLSLRGFAYPLEQKKISQSMDPGLCISNYLVGEYGEVSFCEGELLCVESQD